VSELLLECDNSYCILFLGCSFLFLARDHDGLTLLWRSLVIRSSRNAKGCLSVPVDLVPLIHTDSCRLSALALPNESNFQHESDLPSFKADYFTLLHPPPPYSSSSLSKGVIEARYKHFTVVNTHAPQAQLQTLHFHICSARIGSLALESSPREQDATSSEIKVPEQRMLLFRPLLAVCSLRSCFILLMCSIHPVGHSPCYFISNLCA